MGRDVGSFEYEEHSLILSHREHGHRQGLLEQAPAQFLRGLGRERIGWVSASRDYSRGILCESPWSLLLCPSLF